MRRRAVFLAALVTIAFSLATRGMAATQHVLGRDQNHNGLWDDVENYLYDAYPASSEDFQAFWQLAGAMQRFMEFGSDPKHVARTTDELRRGLECAFYVGRLNAQHKVQALRDRILSTSGRTKAWQDAEDAAKGQPVSMTPDPRLWHQSCRAPVRIYSTWPKD